MSLRSDIVSFWFWGYRGDLRIELQAPVLYCRFYFVVLWDHGFYCITLKPLWSHWWGLNGQNSLVWPRKLAHYTFSSLTFSWLSRDNTFLRTYLTRLLKLLRQTILVRIASSEDLNLLLHCLLRSFCKITCVDNFRTYWKNRGMQGKYLWF